MRIAEVTVHAWDVRSVLDPASRLSDGSLDPEVSSVLRELGYVASRSNADSSWWWTCPKHPDYRRETRESDSGSRRHDSGGCQQPVVVRTEWK